MNGVQTRFKCKLDVKRCKRFVFPPSSLLPRSNALKTKAIRYFQTDRTLTRIVSPPLYRAITKKGVINNTYVIVGAAGYKIGKNSDKEAAIRFRDHDNSNKLESYRVKGLYLTNCVYAYNSMKEGSSIFEGKDKFGNTDSFKIIIYNMDKTQSVECTLGEGTQFVTTWKWVDLTSLGETEGLKFNIKTTKEDQWGAMTPTYFCLDGITIED